MTKELISAEKPSAAKDIARYRIYAHAPAA
jgi:hypothetical protein